jgi:hypothetical protein
MIQLSIMETTVSLSERVFSRVSDIARLTHRTIDEVIEETFEESFTKQVDDLKRSVIFASDDEILALANFQMSGNENARFTELLTKNAVQVLDQTDEAELQGLMQICRFNDLRKAIAINEAIGRGLLKTADDLA